MSENLLWSFLKISLPLLRAFADKGVESCPGLMVLVIPEFSDPSCLPIQRSSKIRFISSVESISAASSELYALNHWISET